MVPTTQVERPYPGTKKRTRASFDNNVINSSNLSGIDSRFYETAQGRRNSENLSQNFDANSKQENDEDAEFKDANQDAD